MLINGRADHCLARFGLIGSAKLTSHVPCFYMVLCLRLHLSNHTNACRGPSRDVPINALGHQCLRACPALSTPVLPHYSNLVGSERVLVIHSRADTAANIL